MLTIRIFKDMIPAIERGKEFEAVAFFRSIKEKMAKATEGMTLIEKRNYWKLMREGKIKIESERTCEWMIE